MKRFICYLFVGLAVVLTSSQANAALETFIITAVAGFNGSISPTGDIILLSGESLTFDITPDPGYLVADVLVDGDSIGASTSFNFNGVTTNHTIEAFFASDQGNYPVTSPVTYRFTTGANPHGNSSEVLSLFDSSAFVEGTFTYDKETSATGMGSEGMLTYRYAISNLAGSVSGMNFSDPSGRIGLGDDKFEYPPGNFTDFLQIAADNPSGPVQNLSGFILGDYVLVNVRMFWIEGQWISGQPSPIDDFLDNQELPENLPTFYGRLALDFVPVATPDDPEINVFFDNVLVEVIDSDADGVPDSEETNVPNNGDANGDGILDSQQINVASQQSIVTGDYVTVDTTAAGSGARLTNMSVNSEAFYGDDPDYDMPFGVVKFDVVGLPVDGSETVRVYYYGVSDLSGYEYRKFDATTGIWYTLPGVIFDAEVIGAETVAYADLYLTDGASGDGDHTADGTIRDPGGPALPDGPTCYDEPVLLGTQYPYYFIQDAYNAIASGSTDTIHVQSMVIDENLILDRDVTVTLKGGYDCYFNEPPVSFSTIGSMTISNGTVGVENIVIQTQPSPPPMPTGLLPDTGQTTSLTDTFGEDSDYTINPPSYTLNPDGTTTDNVTGLLWQSSDDGTFYNWYEATGTPDATYNPGGAVDVCGDLSLAGYNDWRLPDENELQGIVNYDHNAPSIDLTYFPGTTNNGYWSSTTHAFYEDEAWIVHYDFPLVPYGSVSYDSKISAPGYKVRCVRGGQTNQAFTDNGNGTVTDTVTGLTWQQEADGTVRTWEEALTYCENLELPAGQSDWRLPNIKELRSIVDDTTHSPAIDLTYFPDTDLGDYWSSTHGWTYSHHYGVYIPSGAWSISFSIVSGESHDDGYVNAAPTGNNTYARCVRGGQ